MKKVLLPFDGTHFSEGAIKFACSLNRLQPLLLTGLFVPQVTYANLWSFSEAGKLPEDIPLLDERNERELDWNIARFEALCASCHMTYIVHKEVFDFALPELERESRFADLLLIGSERFYQLLDQEDGVNDYLQVALHSAECPVLVVPEQVHFPQQILLAYDGSKSSVYAIRQFAYLFPELADRETVLIYLDPKSREKKVPEEKNIRELASVHFKRLTVMELDTHPGREFGRWLAQNPHALLVCGSYGRSMLSEFVHDSFVKEVIREHRLPVFIAHR
ncbi:universal stress protein [Paraflavisolibacter sp. H34]|uniref:universal stress protein n=1 Tax=Huijunlia imazamoxiresistens TaxID=3127457 RepID=UPI0030179850